MRAGKEIADEGARTRDHGRVGPDGRERRERRAGPAACARLGRGDARRERPGERFSAPIARATVLTSSRTPPRLVAAVTATRYPRDSSRRTAARSVPSFDTT